MDYDNGNGDKDRGGRDCENAGGAFIIKWIYYTNEGEEGYFSQAFRFNEKGNVIPPAFCGGAYIASLYGACKIDELDDRISRFRESVAWTAWLEKTSALYRRLNVEDENRQGEKEKYILFDSVAYVAFVIFGRIREFLKTVVNRPNDIENTEVYKYCTRAKISVETNTQDAMNECLENYMRQYHKMLKSLCSELSDMRPRYGGEEETNFYEELKECLKEYCPRRISKEYLTEKGRCFAAFVNDNHEKFVTLSGFWDTAHDGEEGAKILKWLGTDGQKQKECAEFSRAVETISRSLGATYVHSNLQTSVYGLAIDSDCARVFRRQSLGDVIAERLSATDFKKYFSCCERKIFGYFHDATPDGNLYVKFEMCGKCLRGLWYQHSCGSRICVHDGLGV